MIYDVRLIDAGNTTADCILFWIQVATFIFALVSTWLLLKDYRKQRHLEKMKLSITPRDKFGNCVDKVFFLYLAFMNESCLPISILDIRIDIPKEGHVTNSEKGEGGTVILTSIPVSESETRYPNSKIITHNADSLSVPFTIEPYTSLGGYIAFHAGRQDAHILCHKDLNLHVRTSRDSFEIKMILTGDNFYDLSYRHDGTMFGRAFITNPKHLFRMQCPRFLKRKQSKDLR